MARTAVATEAFTGTGALSSDWANLMTAIRGNVTRSSDQAVGAFTASGNDHPMARWVGAGTFTDDQYSEVTLRSLALLGSTNREGVLVRQGSGTGSSATGYEGLIHVNGSGTYTTLLVMRNGTTYTTLHSASVAWANGDKLSLEVEGTELRLCKNGTPLGGSFTQTDSTHSTGQPGIICTAGVNIDDWEGGSLGSGGASGVGGLVGGKLLSGILRGRLVR